MRSQLPQPVGLTHIIAAVINSAAVIFGATPQRRGALAAGTRSGRTAPTSLKLHPEL